MKLDTNKKYYCFLNKILCDETRKPLRYQIALNLEGEFKVVLLNLTLMEVYELLEEYKDNLVTDFVFRNEFVCCDKNVPSQIMSEELIKMNIPKEQILDTDIKNIYGLINILAGIDGYIIDDTVIDAVGESYKGVGVLPLQSLTCSKTSMTLFYRVLLEDGWYTRSIIYEERDMLNFKPFYFCIEKCDEYLLKDYKVEFVKTCEVLNRVMQVYRIKNDISIYVHSLNSLRIIPPIVLRYMFNSTLYESIMNVCDVIINDIGKLVYVESSDVPNRESRSTRSLNRTKIKFNLSEKVFSKKECGILIREYLESLHGGMTFEEFEKSLGNNFIKRYCCRVINNILSKQVPPLDKLEYTIKIRNIYSAKKLASDSYLYAIKVGIYSSNDAINNASFMDLYGTDMKCLGNISKE